MFCSPFVMASLQWMTWTPAQAPDSDDRLLVADTSDSFAATNSSIEEVVQAWLSASTSDQLPQGGTNLYLTSSERTKLAGIAVWADVSPVFSVQGDIGNVLLTQDDIPDGSNFVRTQNNFSDAKDDQLTDAFQHSVIISGNPHNVTQSDIWLDNVLNKEQLTKEPNDWSFAQDQTLEDEDIFLIEDSTDGFSKKVIEFRRVIASLINKSADRVKNSIEQDGGSLQLVNDEDTPPEGYAYMNLKWNKWWHSPLVRYIYDSNEDIHIPFGHQMIVQWGIVGWANITGGWILVILS